MSSRSPSRNLWKILASSCTPSAWLPPSRNSRKILLYRPMSALLCSRSLTMINTAESLNPPPCSLWSQCFTTGYKLQTVPVQLSASCYLITARPLTLSIIRYLSLRSMASICRRASKPGWLTFWQIDTNESSCPQTASLSGVQSPPEFLKETSSALGFSYSWSMISRLTLLRGSMWTTISQIIPRGSLGDLQHAVTAVEDCSRSQRMQLNAEKCKEMAIDFKKISHNFCPLKVRRY